MRSQVGLADLNLGQVLGTFTVVYFEKQIEVQYLLGFHTRLAIIA